jgi:hypothetical protein
MWQDYAIAAITTAFIPSLLPQVMDVLELRKEVNPWTSSITGIGCILLAVVFMTLQLPISAVIAIGTGFLWLVMFGKWVIHREDRLKP